MKAACFSLFLLLLKSSSSVSSGVSSFTTGISDFFATLSGIFPIWGSSLTVDLTTGFSATFFTETSDFVSPVDGPIFSTFMFIFFSPGDFFPGFKTFSTFITISFSPSVDFCTLSAFRSSSSSSSCRTSLRLASMVVLDGTRSTLTSVTFSVFLEGVELDVIFLTLVESLAEPFSVLPFSIVPKLEGRLSLSRSASSSSPSSFATDLPLKCFVSFVIFVTTNSFPGVSLSSPSRAASSLSISSFAAALISIFLATSNFSFLLLFSSSSFSISPTGETFFPSAEILTEATVTSSLLGCSTSSSDFTGLEGFTVSVL